MARTQQDTKKRNPIGVRLTEEAYGALDSMAQRMGVTLTAVIEMAVREKAVRDGVPLVALPPKPADPRD